ncbi:MAG: chemotaxis protein CheW [Desulfobacterales bacterium]|jgi:purine-binding chemotaxis protein CheW
MHQSSQTDTNKDRVELATFFVGDALCGMDILKVQEINKLIDMTKVPQAPEYVLGILNLRGEIVTVIDLGKKLGLKSTDLNDKTRNVIVNSNEEHIGLMVERIDDVVQAEWGKVEKPPANICGVQGKFFAGVYKTEDRLVGILDVEKVLEDDR